MLFPESSNVVFSDSTDYVEFSPVLVSYTGGVIQQDTMSFTIEIINDDIPEPSRESFEIVGVARKNLFFPLPIMTITIVDDDEGRSNCDDKRVLVFRYGNSLMSAIVIMGVSVGTIRLLLHNEPSNIAQMMFLRD